MSDNRINARDNIGTMIQDSEDIHIHNHNDDIGKLNKTFTINPPDFGTEVIGRKSLIKDGMRMLKSENLLVLQGMGGIGKTKIAKEIYYNAKGYRYKGWVTYSDEKGIKASIVEAMEFYCGLKFPEKSTVDQKYGIIIGALNQTSGKVLIVLDNVDAQPSEDNDINIIFTMDETMGCDVLVTSRCRLTKDDRTKEVSFLKEKDSLKLFYLHYELEKNDALAKEIIKLAGKHTMTIELLAKIAQTGDIRLAEFVEKLNEQSFDLQDIMEKVRTEWDGYTSENELSKHLQKLFAIDNLTEDEKKLLAHMSLVTKAPISRTLARDLLNLKGYFEIIKLIDKGWIMKSEEVEVSIQMHPVVHSAVCNQYELDVEDDEALDIIVRVAKLLKWDVKGYYGDVLQYLPLAQDVLERTVEWEADEVGFLLNELGFVYEDKGEYDKALEYYEKSLDIKKKVYGEDHPSTGTTYNNIAAVWKEKGEYDKALEYYDKDLVICEKVYGKDHPSTGTTYNNIALVWQEKGEQKEALEYYEKTSEIFKKVYGEDHQSTGTTYNNIAGVWKARGDYDKALEYYEKALDIREKALGKEHPLTGTTYNNIALVWQEKGEHNKALEYNTKCIKIFFDKLGKEHPNTKIVLNNCKYAYLAYGLPEENFDEWLEDELKYAE